MGRFVASRLAALVPVLLGISVVVFVLIRLIPGSALEMFLGTQVEATPEQMRELERLFGEDQPIPVQYVRWVGRLLRGDFGCSLRTSRPVLPDIIARLPVSAELALAALLVAVAVGVPLGIASAVRHNSWVDMFTRVGGMVGVSMPDFWLATMLILLSSRYLGIGTVGEFERLTVNPAANIKAVALPALAYGLGLAAVLMRYTRASLLEVLREDYIRTARAKGLSGHMVVWRHALKNSLVPVVTVVGFYAGYLLGGTVVIEEVYALPGMGRLALYAIQQRDYPVIQGIVLIVATCFVLVNLLVDLAYASLDPRIRYG